MLCKIYILILKIKKKILPPFTCTFHTLHSQQAKKIVFQLSQTKVFYFYLYT